MRTRPAELAERVERIAKEIAIDALLESNPRLRRACRRDARNLLDIARLLRWRRWKAAQGKSGRMAASSLIPLSVKRFLRRDFQ